jgi:hypothetical protein
MIGFLRQPKAILGSWRHAVKTFPGTSLSSPETSFDSEIS